MDNVEDKAISWRPLVFVCIAVTVVWTVSGVGLYSWSPEERGTFGDMFGAVNALFSGLAFGGVIYAIWLQQQELRLQRNELKLTRTELEGQKEALTAQNLTLREQNFSSTFFQLLRVLNDIINAIDVLESRQTGEVAKGRDAFRVFITRFRNRWWADIKKTPSSTEDERLRRVYSGFYEENEADLGHYFRTLYNLVKFVDKSEAKDKKLYTNLIRAQLSSLELALLFYNCQSDYGRDKFKPLLEKYALLKTLPRSVLVNPDHLTLYDHSAYR